MKESRLLLLIATLALISGYTFVLLAIQQLMKQMRFEVDAQNATKLSKYQTVWNLWPKHRAVRPDSKLRKIHGLLIVGVVLSLAAYGLITVVGWYLS